jgi:hypothetical protein
MLEPACKTNAQHIFANLVLATRSTTLRERSTDSLTPVRSPGVRAGLTVYVAGLPSAPSLRPTAVLGGTQKAKCPMGQSHRAFCSGDVLLSHSLIAVLPSGLQRFTAVFGFHADRGKEIAVYRDLTEVGNPTILLLCQ